MTKKVVKATPSKSPAKSSSSAEKPVKSAKPNSDKSKGSPVKKPVEKAAVAKGKPSASEKVAKKSSEASERGKKSEVLKKVSSDDGKVVKKKKKKWGKAAKARMALKKMQSQGLIGAPPRRAASLNAGTTTSLPSHFDFCLTSCQIDPKDDRLSRILRTMSFDIANHCFFQSVECQLAVSLSFQYRLICYLEIW